MSRAVATQRFLYRAMSAGSGVTQGEIESVDRRNASEELRRRGLVVLEIKSAQPPGMADRLRGFALGRDASEVAAAPATQRDAGARWRRVRAEVFAELALLIESGMGMDSALETIVPIAKKPSDTSALRALSDAVREGRTLAEAMRRLPGRFDPFHIGMVQAGEDSGKLADVLRRLNAQDERALRLRRDLVSSLMYPCILIFVGTLIMTAIVSFVVPKFSELFDEMGVSLPWFSAVVIGVCRSVADWGVFALAAMLLAVFVWRVRWRDPVHRAAIERWALEKTPFGPLLWKHQGASFAGAMAMMLRSGVPILRALEVARTTWSSVELRNRLDRVIGAMRDGGRLSDAAREASLLPDRTEKLLGVGEESGNLAKVFERMADAFEEDVAVRTKRALTLLEPVAILLIGSVVGTVVIAMILAIFSIYDQQAV
ncbi:MAG: type II secretion system F family protein [Phycisphaerales bacterium]|nr:MAG: type II secretion system F family protein [Phycisphaerales bacterium]